MYYCIDCDYTMTRDYFDAGKGRIMFSAGKGLQDGTFRCGVCDDRCDDPEGMFPNDESEEDEEKSHKLKLKQVLDELLLLEMSVAQYDDSCKFIRWKDYLRKDFYDQQH